MNLETDLAKEKQESLYKLGIKSENREYSKDEIKTFSNRIGDFIFSKSLKNGDMSKAFLEFGDILTTFVKNEK